MRGVVLTLRKFVELCGGQQAAAVELGVLTTTVWRWLNKTAKPKGNNARRLKELGVIV